MKWKYQNIIYVRDILFGEESSSSVYKIYM